MGGFELVPQEVERIEALHMKANESAVSAVEYAIECGRELLTVKQRLPHGHFETWCQQLSFTVRTARRYMQAALADPNRTRVSDLSLRSLLKSISSEQDKAEREQDIARQRELIEEGVLVQPAGVFDVIAIDPPWNYGREYDPETSRVANPYPEMTQDQLKEIVLPAADDCVLFLWTTHQFLFDAKELLDHWGFDYKATMVWDKERIGMGSWLRMQCEFCLVGIKGSPFWENTEHRDIIREARREHSRKPERFYEIVEKITAGRRLEYFSRSAREGWEVFGNDTAKF